MPIINSIADLKNEAAAWRQELHQNPQTCYEEEFASAFVKNKLQEWNIPFRDGYAKTGLVATIEGQKNTSGKTIGLRADMDALDILEKTGLPHASKNVGKMHACGHDGHTASLLAAAKYLQDTKNFNGRVHLIFQPAEEGGRGAVKMIEEGLFDAFPCDYVFGVHNWPGLPIGHIDMRVGAQLASVDEFNITVKGKGGHAAMPHLTHDPLVIASHIVIALQSIVSRNIDPVESAVVTVAGLQVGTDAFNVIGDTATMKGTVRTFNNDVRHQIRDRIETIATNIAKSYDATAELDYEFQLDPTINTADGIAMAQEAASAVVNPNHINTECPPSMGGEDFGAYLMEKPGAFICVGQSVPDDKNSPHNHGLHSPYYDFNDDIIPIVASYFGTLCEKYMPLS
ncbi:MAG: amidohydrolase [Micavibrio sp.]|nr:amidohydrolase [Micavibrio sp.]|tara:strand:- start:3782 stop:4975 length:1194 start_codon:yes stop_codon:yes gene_type:complete